MSIVILHKVFGLENVGIVHFNEIPGAWVVRARLKIKKTEI